MEKRLAAENILVSIIVPCRNERHFIGKFIDNIYCQEPVEGCCELIVADGMSDDGTREILNEYKERYPFLVMLDNPERTTSYALNRAIRAAMGTIIIRMDVHTEYARDYVQKCVEVLNQTCAENVGGPARTKASSYMQKAIQLAYHSPFAVGGAKFHDLDYEGYVDTITYGCWHKQTLVNLGLFDEELVRNQDDELNLRIIRSGGKIWQSSDIKSWYYPRASLKQLFKQYMQYGYWKVRVIQKHRIPASVRHVIPGTFVATLIILTVFSFFSRAAMTCLYYITCLYVAANLAATANTCRKKELLLYLPVMPFVFATYHISYGLGFLLGCIDFVVLHKGGRLSFGRITRG